MLLARAIAVVLLLDGCIFDTGGVQPARRDAGKDTAADKDKDRAAVDVEIRTDHQIPDVRLDSPSGPCAGKTYICQVATSDGGSSYFQTGQCVANQFNYQRSCGSGGCKDGVCRVPDDCRPCTDCTAGEICTAYSAGTSPGGTPVFKACCATKDVKHGDGNGTTPCQPGTAALQCATGLCTSANVCFESCVGDGNSASCRSGLSCQKNSVFESGLYLAGMSCYPSNQDAGADSRGLDLAASTDAGPPDAANDGPAADANVGQ